MIRCKIRNCLYFASVNTIHLAVCELQSPSMSDFLWGLENSGWLRHIKAIMDAGIFIAKVGDKGRAASGLVPRLGNGDPAPCPICWGHCAKLCLAEGGVAWPNAKLALLGCDFAEERAVLSLSLLGYDRGQ